MKNRHERSEPISSRSHYETALGIFENNPVLTISLTALCFVVLVLEYLGWEPSSLLYLSWDLFVYLTPSRIVVALDHRVSNTEAAPRDSPLSLHEKSQAMMRIIGSISTNNSFPFFPRPRPLSALGSALLGTTRDAAPPGLGNWNNSCFQNSIMQGLASLKSFSEFLEQNMDGLPDANTLSTHQALRSLIISLNSPSNHGKKLWIEGSLKSMSSWHQQDAQEYFSTIVDQIDLEAKKASHGEILNPGLKIAGPEENIVHSGHDGSCSEQDGSTSTHNPLEGLLAQRVGCMACGHSDGLSMIPFSWLTLSLDEKYETNIQECLDRHMTLELLEDVECAKCTLLHRQDQLIKLLVGMDGETESQSESQEKTQPFDAMKLSATSRLEEVKTALENKDFSEITLAEKCHIPSKNRISTTKSKQTVIARAPKCLAFHINRSIFDGMTGMLKKNHAAVAFPQTIDLNPWCLGSQASSKFGESLEQWESNPSKSMLPQPGETVDVPSRLYHLRAVVTHYGRHENGHYICYRKYPTSGFSAPAPDEILQAEGDKENPERWWRLSDDDVEMVSEGHVMSQGGGFMLFYETVEDSVSPHSRSATSEDAEHVYANSYEEVQLENADSIDTSPTPEDTSTSSTVTDDGSSTSRATSISIPLEEEQTNVAPTKQSSTHDADATHDEFGSPSVLVA